MEIFIEIVFLIGVVLFFVYKYLAKYIEKKQAGFHDFYNNIQENTIRDTNGALNYYLLLYSDEPSIELEKLILDIIYQNQSYIILTFMDDKVQINNQSPSFTNSVNFMKIKNGDIGVFTDFELMRSYVRINVSTEILKIGDFIKLCKEHEIESLTLNFILKNPFRLTMNQK